jgi:hypothetical protein
LRSSSGAQLNFWLRSNFPCASVTHAGNLPEAGMLDFVGFGYSARLRISDDICPSF